MTRFMKKILTTLLAVAMILTLPGATVFAEDAGSDSGTTEYTYSIIYDSVQAIDSITTFPEDEEFTSEYAEATHAITETVPEAEGYTFEGWSTDPSVSDPEALLAAGSEVTLTADNSALTLYAVWSDGSEEAVEDPEAEDAGEAEESTAAAIGGPRKARAANTDSYTIYLKNEANWASPHVFIWREGQQYNPTGAWPGAVMSLDSATGLYYYTFTNSQWDSVGVIFNNGNGGDGNQTADQTYSNSSADLDLYSNANLSSTSWSSALGLEDKTIGIDEEIGLTIPAGYKVTSWTSSDDTVASVTTTGDSAVTIKGIKEGTATITAAMEDGSTRTATIKVVKENAVYFDATLSKLSYKGSSNEGYGGGGMPYSNDQSGAPETNVIYAAFSKSSDGSNHTELKAMTAPTTVTKTINGVQHTFSDTYRIAIPAGYENGYVRFYSKKVDADTIIDDKWYGQATGWMKLDSDATCFYADTSDKTIYDGGLREGYWDAPYTIRDPEKENAAKTNSKDIVTVTGTDSFTRQAKTLYVDSSFYDYYTDFELNGTNEYYNSSTESTTGSQRSYVRYRQFNQALSDYYGTGTDTKLYEGHFQPSVGGWGNQFKDIQATLGLNGYTESPAFYSSNNSVMANAGNISDQGRYDDAAWGLVNSSLEGYYGKGTGSLLTSDGSEVLPFFNSDFLLGNNSKNTVLGNVYSDVKFPFTKVEDDHVDYWEFDSAETTLHMQQSSSGQYYLQDVGHQNWSKNVDSTGTVSSRDGVSNTYGFFPLNDTDVGTGSMRYNYGFGTRLDFPFKLTADGDVFADDGSGVKKPITFEFSGDDDVWVFIDGKLVMDIGGEHGRTSGVINFSNDGLAYNFSDTTGTKQTKVTHTVPGNTVWVSGVKASVQDSTDNGSTGVEKSLSDIVGDLGTGKHVVTMFYMERGQWESNMKVRFNWPDQNDLTVEKAVDTSEVNTDLMNNTEIADIFKNQDFTFGIENLATHYGDKDNGYSAPEPITYTPGSASPASSVVNFASSGTYAGSYQWSAKTAGTDWANRYGILSTPEGFNIDAPNANGNAATRRTLTFSYLYQHNYSGYDMKLDRASIELEDMNGNKISGLLSTCATATTLKRGTWGTMTVDLTKLGGSGSFDYTKLKSIKFAYQDYQNLSFYLKDFTFSGAATGTGQTGTSFGVKQNEIPDYTSAASGELEPANGAEYTKNVKGGSSSTAANVSNGQFTLKDNECATFVNQFRRGSYISVTEKNVDTDLYSVSWSLSDANGTALSGDGTAPEDNRTELVSAQADLIDTDDKTNNRYSKTYKNQNPDGKDTDQASFVFRNFRDPEDMIESIDVTASVVNKVNTGSIKLKKVQADNSFPITQKYHFKVTITSVAGVTLSTPIVYEYDLGIGEETEITGIPLNSNYTITETNPNGEENVSLDTVTKNGEKMSFNGDAANGYTVTDALEKREDGNSVYSYEFSNIKSPKVNVELTKKWVDPAGDPYNTNLPEGIYVQLQRKAASESAFTPIDIKGYTITGANTEADGVYFSVYYLKPDASGNWTAAISGLLQYKDNNDKDPYEYRIVEVEQDENGAIAVDDKNQPKVAAEGTAVTYNGTTYEVQPTETTDNTKTVLTNKMKASYGFDIRKVNEKDTTEVLSDVTFALYTDEACTEANRIKFTQAGSIYTRDDKGTVDTLTTSTDGVFAVSDLPTGTYYLKELQAKDGYYLFGSPIRIVLTEKSTTDSATVVDAGKATGTVTGTKWENRTLSFEITNKPGVILPGTGGLGRNIFLLLLGGLALIGAFLFWNKKILSERRAKAGHR